LRLDVKVTIFAIDSNLSHTMIKISATILTFNEERRIEACLESLRDIADEIIVVDSGSTDRTLEIASRYGCRISQRELDGFGAQRQYATSLTRHSYVLAIDADEVLSPELRQCLIKLKANVPEHRVYAFSRLNFYCGFAVHHCGWSPDIQIRLFDKRYANWNLRDVQERVIFRDSVKPEVLQGELLHNRCDAADEYRDTLSHQATIKAGVLATAKSAIGPLTPALKGVKAFLITYIKKRGFLDGAVGLAISRHQYYAGHNAYAEARRIKKQNP